MDNIRSDPLINASHADSSRLPSDFKPACKRRDSETSVFDDGTNSYFWRTHTASVLLIGVCGLVYVVFLEEQKKDIEYNIKRGIVAAVYTFLAFGVTQAKDGPLIRPHPAFWRLVLCISVLYELGLVFLLFQTVGDARKLLNYVDHDLGKPLDFRAYGGSCSIYDPGHPDGAFHNVLDKMDIFVIGHLFGWFWKALILRDMWLTNVISFMFELLEYTFEHQLPNFSECWWDHWILDFLLCNGFGIYFGLKFVKYLSFKEYKWRGLWKIPSYKGKVRRVVGQFSPYSWVVFRWKPTENLFRWLFVSMLTFMFLLAELNTFYLKFVLWIPPDHPFVTLRLGMYTLWGFVAVREVYDYIGEKTKSFGQQAWVLCAIILTELMLVFKFGLDVLSVPFPLYIRYFWICAFIAYMIWSMWKFQMKFPRFRRWMRLVIYCLKADLQTDVLDVPNESSDSDDNLNWSDNDLTKEFQMEAVFSSSAGTSSAADIECRQRNVLKPVV